MRRLLATGIGLWTALTASAVQAQGALGANFNEQAQDLDFGELKRADARWVHLQLNMSHLDRGPAAGNGAVKTVLNAASQGLGTMFSLRFPYADRDFPAAGSPELEREFAKLDTVLPLVMGKVDILVIGGDPYIDSRPADRDLDLNAFYEALAARAIAYRKANCAGTCKTRLFMAGPNRLDIKSNQTPSTERWLAYVKATPEIEGVGFRMYLPALAASQAFLDYSLPRMRPDQKFIVPDFSLVWAWIPNLKANIPPAFADKYQAPRSAQTWQIIKASLETPFSKGQWDEFMSQSTWIETRKHYLRNQMKLFRDTGRLAVAAVNFKQGKSLQTNFDATRQPWLLSTIYADRTVKRNPDGTAAFNYAWIDDFKALQVQ